MNKTMCPGQDTRYWRPGDIFNVPCASCGKDVEFFKDDAKRRCGRCGAIVQNPRLSMGCALWCGHAKECLGYDPAGMSSDETSAGSSIADALMESIRSEFGAGSVVAQDALEALERANILLKKSAANPRVVIPAVILLLVDRYDHSCGPAANAAGASGNNHLPVAEKFLGAAGADRNTVEDVCAIIRAYHSGRPVDTAEYRAVAQSRGQLPRTV